MTRWAVTVNVGGTFASNTVKEGMLRWARASLKRDPIFVFAQEVPSQAWLDVWVDAGYICVLGPDCGWRVRSALLIAPDQHVVPLTGSQGASSDPALDALRYHGSYVAAARWTSARGTVVLASVHASPSEADPVTHGWSGAVVTPRSGGGDPRYPGGRLWDSDLLLETLRFLNTLGPLLAAGDLNEALGFDETADGTPMGTWGAEYFRRMHEAHLSAWLTRHWETERPTHGRLQLDHVVVSDDADGMLSGSPPPHLDCEWANTQTATNLGDHVPIWFSVDSDWIPTTI